MPNNFFPLLPYRYNDRMETDKIMGRAANIQFKMYAELFRIMSLDGSSKPNLLTIKKILDTSEEISYFLMFEEMMDRNTEKNKEIIEIIEYWERV